MHYRQAAEYNSNPFKFLYREKYQRNHGFLFTITCIYLPIALLTAALRAVMLLMGVRVISLGVVDRLIMYGVTELKFQIIELFYMVSQ